MTRRGQHRYIKHCAVRKPNAKYTPWVIKCELLAQTQCVCVCIADIRGLEPCHPLMALPVTLASKQEKKYVSAACHTQIVECFLYGWLESERQCRGSITQAQQVILEDVKLSLRVQKGSNRVVKYYIMWIFCKEGEDKLTNKTWLEGK